MDGWAWQNTSVRACLRERGVRRRGPGLMLNLLGSVGTGNMGLPAGIVGSVIAQLSRAVDFRARGPFRPSARPVPAGA